MKANIEISEETMSMLSGALDLSPLYDEEYGVDEDTKSNIAWFLNEMGFFN